MTHDDVRGSAPAPELVALRRSSDENAALPDTDGVAVDVVEVGGVEAWRFTPAGASADSALVHFHGGGFRMGSPRGFARFLARAAGALGVTIIAPRYRLAPEAAFPAAIADGVAVYSGLLEQGIPATRLAIGGDSAGGGLAAAVALRLAQLGIQAPAGVALFSPWVDLRLTAASYQENAGTDTFFTLFRAGSSVESYLQGQDPADPLASPVLGDWRGRPPLLIQVSDIESLRDDSLELARRASEAGVDVTLTRFPDTGHVWHNAFPTTDQSVVALENWRRWLAGVGVPVTDAEVRR